MMPGHIVEKLFERLDQIADYPIGVKPISGSQRILCTAFFPAGHGLWDPAGKLPPLPSRPVVIVGHNWGIPSDFDEALADGIEFSDTWSKSRRQSCTTWFNLLAMLDAAGIARTDCFFTNAYVGLKNDGKGNRGRFPGADSPAFVEQCRQLLAESISLLKPRLVLTLGEDAFLMLSGHSSEFNPWKGPRGGFRNIKTVQSDRSSCCVQFSVADKLPSAVAVPLYHPSEGRNHHPNLPRQLELIAFALSIAPSAGLG